MIDVFGLGSGFVHFCASREHDTETMLLALRSWRGVNHEPKVVTCTVVRTEIGSAILRVRLVTVA